MHALSGLSYSATHWNSNNKLFSMVPFYVWTPCIMVKFLLKSLNGETIYILGHIAFPLHSMGELTFEDIVFQVEYTFRKGIEGEEFLLDLQIGVGKTVISPKGVASTGDIHWECVFFCSIYSRLATCQPNFDHFSRLCHMFHNNTRQNMAQVRYIFQT